MMSKSISHQRLSAEFHRLLSLTMKRFAWTLTENINLTRVEVSPDLHWAHAYFTTGQKTNIPALTRELNQSQKQWKKRLATNWKHRRLPNIVFHHDCRVVRSGEIASLLEDLKTE